MIKVAIVEDDKEDADMLEGFLLRYGEEFGEKFQITRYEDGLLFLTNYQAVYDLVFMDIEMPGLNGMESARKLRELDTSVVLIFVTNLTRYALNGYEVEALDYILKPLKYSAFSLKIAKAVMQCARRNKGRVFIRMRDGINSFQMSSVMWVESRGHDIVYHTQEGNLHAYGTLKEVEEQLGTPCFFRCNSCYIVNLNYIVSFQKSVISLSNGEELSVSRSRKKKMLEAIYSYFLLNGGGYS